MRNFRLLALALIALVAGACQPTTQELMAALDKGVAGYEGQVTPFTVPYLLRYRNSPEIKQTVNMRITFPDGKTQNNPAEWTVKISEIGNQRLFEYKWYEIFGDGKVWRSNVLPLVLIRATSSPTGPFDNVDADFPASRQQGEKIPDKETEIYQNLVRSIQRSSFQLPEDPVNMNDELLPKEMILGLLPSILPEPTKAKIIGNTLATRVVGQTYKAYPVVPGS